MSLHSILSIAVILNSTVLLGAESVLCGKDNSIIVVPLPGTNSWHDCTGDRGVRQEFSLPKKARFFPFKSRVLRDDYGNYPTHISKLDIVWISDEIVVSSPLRSYGGDIILYGRTIRLNAPVDSRVYIQQGVDRFKERAERGPRKTSTFFTPAFELAFRDYFFDCGTCETVITHRPELPGGLAALTPNLEDLVSIDGDDAPPVISDNVRSGNIYIFAERIIVGDDLKGSGTPAIIADGATGGRGGPGSVSSCIDTQAPPSQFTCVQSRFENSGRSGRPSDGADAGNITINLIASEANYSMDRAHLAKLISVQGGSAGDNAIYRSPASDGPNKVLPSRAAFRKEGEHPAAKPGQSGVFLSRSASADEAIRAVATLLSLKDLRSDYDYFPILQVGRLDSTIYSFSPASAFSDYLADSLTRAQIAVIKDMERLFALGKPSIGGYTSPLFAGLSEQSLEGMPIRPEQTTILLEISRLSGTGGFIGMLQRTGGLLNIASRGQVVQRMSSGQLRVDVARGNITLATTVGILRNIDLALFNFTLSRGFEELRGQMTQAQQQLSKLEVQVREAAASDASMSVALERVVAMGKAVAALAVALYNNQYGAAALAASSVTTAYNALSMTAYDPSIVAKIPRLRVQLQELEGRLERLGEYFASAKAEFFATQVSDLVEVLRARRSLRTKLVADNFMALDIAKYAVVSFLQDPSRDKSYLRANLFGLQTYLQEYPDVEPIMKLREVEWTCDDPTLCATVEANGSLSRAVRAQFPIMGKMHNIPLWIVAPSTRRQTLPTFGLSSSTVTIALPAR